MEYGTSTLVIVYLDRSVVESPSVDVCGGNLLPTGDGGQPVDETESLHKPPVASIEERDGAVIVRLVGELDLYNAHLVRDELVAAAEREPERLVVELSGVTRSEEHTSELQSLA